MVSRWRMAYSYAKISGRLSKSFLGRRVGLLAGCESAHELYALVFGDPVPEATVPELIEKAGQALQRRLEETYRLVERLFGGGNAFITQTMRRVEFENAKTLARALRRAEARMPALKPAPGAEEIKRSAYPDPAGLFSGTRFEWIAGASPELEIWELENRLDRQYYVELMDCARSLPLGDRPRLRAAVAAEARLENAVWAVRLNAYYGMDAKRISESLIALPGMDAGKAARAAAGFSPEEQAAWSSWYFSPLVNKESRASPWRIDPAAVESAARRRLYSELRRVYHAGPFSLIPAYAFLRLKQIEGDFIRSGFEGMRMSMGPAELGALLGASA